MWGYIFALYLPVEERMQQVLYLASVAGPLDKQTQIFIVCYTTTFVEMSRVHNMVLLKCNVALTKLQVINYIKSPNKGAWYASCLRVFIP